MMSMSSNDHPQVSPDHGAPVDLPTPWIRQYDTNFMTYFYVNPSTNPPTSTWQHPSLPSGEAAPEQLDALNSTPAQGHAAHYLNSTSEDAPLPAAGQYPTASTGNAGTEGPDGDRSIAMAVGMHFAMGKIKEKVKESKQNQEGTGDGGSSAGGDKKHTGPIAMLGKKAGDLLGVNKQANNASTPGPTNNEGTHAPQVDLTSTGQYAQPSGRPPFMSSRGRGGGPMGAGRGAGAQRGRGGRGGRGGSRGMAGDHHEAVYGQ